MKVYLAGALFSISERNFNLEFADKLRVSNDAVEFIIPQLQAKKDLGKPNFEQLVFDFCVKGVEEAEIVIAMLEGPDVDSGTCIELGIAYAMKKRVIGIRTDLRGSEFEGLNIMVRKVLNHYIHLTQLDSKVEDLAAQVNKILLENHT